MRARPVVPELFHYPDLWRVEQTTRLPVRLAFMALLCAADREGRFRWEPCQLKLHCMPFDSVNFEEVLAVLYDAGLLRCYECGDTRYGHIIGFSQWTRPNHRERESTLPPPEAGVNCQPRVSGGQTAQLPTPSPPSVSPPAVVANNGGRAAAKPASKTDSGFPLRDGKTWYLSRKKHEEYQDSYPELDLIREYRKARQWLRDNPKKRKSAGGMPQFLSRWLARVADRMPPPATDDWRQNIDIRRSMS